MAATLALGPGTVLSHRSAGELWGIVARSSRAIEVVRPTNARDRLQIVAHRSLLPDDELTMVDRIPLTTVPRTILDLAAVVSPRQLERALNEVEVQDLTDRLSVPDLLARYPRRRGTAVLCALLGEGAERRGVTKSELEERFVALLDEHELPRPRLNADLVVSGRAFIVDCMWAAERLIVELDGQAVHGTAKAFEADRERDRLLLADGWRVMRITWRQLRNQEPSIAADLRKALARARSSR
jgi:very-short-patch-repair endonuclease